MIAKDWLRPVLFPIHKEGYKSIAVFAIITIILGIYGNAFWFMVGLILTVWCVLFFRDPVRITPIGENFVVAPADGVVQSIKLTKLPEELADGDEEEYLRISIFMNVFNAHINRTPVVGVINKIRYKAGKFFNADLEKASTLNERQSFEIETEKFGKVYVVQIAGLVAKRIVGFLSEGDSLIYGEKIGMIKFGSRVDVYLPKNIEPLVCINQIAIGGETIIADFEGNQVARKGVVS